LQHRQRTEEVLIVQLSLEMGLHQWDGIRLQCLHHECEREGDWSSLMWERERSKAIDVYQFSHSMRVHNWDVLTKKRRWFDSLCAKHTSTITSL